MTYRLIIGVLLIAGIAACGDQSPTFSQSEVQTGPVLEKGTTEKHGQFGEAYVKLKAKLDSQGHQAPGSSGMAYYRVEIDNTSGYKLAVSSVTIHFQDKLDIVIRKCRLRGDNGAQQYTQSTWLEPNMSQSLNGSCDFPVSQMEKIKKAIAVADLRFWN